MHDANGTPLNKGDVVLIPAVITDLSPGEEFCNVCVETVHGRRPDGAKERMSAINTGVLVKFANAAKLLFIIALICLTFPSENQAAGRRRLFGQSSCANGQCGIEQAAQQPFNQVAQQTIEQTPVIIDQPIAQQPVSSQPTYGQPTYEIVYAHRIDVVNTNRSQQQTALAPPKQYDSRPMQTGYVSRNDNYRPMRTVASTIRSGVWRLFRGSACRQ